MLGRERPWDEPRQFPRDSTRKRNTWHGYPGSYGAVGPPLAADPSQVETDKAEPAEYESWLFGRTCTVLDRLRSLKRHYGSNLLLLIFNVQHVMKGFAVNFTVVAEQFLYRSYNVPATDMQAYNAVTNLPWSMKPIIGLISDVLPIFGYNKAPYALLTSLAGTAAFLDIGLLSQKAMPEWALVTCLFLCSLQVSTADVLTQGRVTAKVNDAPTPSLRTNLLVFAWSGGDVCALIAVISSGFVIHYCGARLTYLIAAVPGATFVLLVARGCYEERCISREQLADIRGRFWEQIEACLLSVLMLIGAAVIICSLTANKSFLVHGVVSLCVAVVILFSFSLLLTPSIAKMNAFNFMYSIMSLSTDAASFYFFTDTVEQYPEGPHLSVFFFTTVRGAVQFAFSFLGIYTYQALSEGWTYRRWMIMSTFLFAAVNVLNVMMYRRVNVQLGVSDEVWVLGTTALVSVVDKWKWMPRMVSICYMSPRGMESTFSALLMGCHNIGWAISANVGALLLSFLGVAPKGAPRESAQFANLWVASAWMSVVPPVVVLLLCWLAADQRQDVSLVGDSRGAATANSLWQRLRGHGCEERLPLPRAGPRQRRSTAHG
uniref:Folate/biopterin transporter n=1 Tax=Alexandrium catenella TaxID=2925 RepID=A0A7S1RWT4_ALECA|mmetsp:Transcript_7414/g.20056  ORF Transcript_7414/g.20056 Transcript_7414/m.20056 type:complete len:602 (+) Transcript_7414:99-1904(+)